tara:strand:+ start:400 stop:1008 length:609 start_codon:yes stop_codon:yes gene_type:complete
MIYDEDYYERGVETGRSLYSNFRWMPELTIPLAYEMIKVLKLNDGDKVLDYGCAKGYLVKALRLLQIDAMGYDISEYAIGKADADVKEHVGNTLPNMMFHAVIAKDVFEHMTEEQVKKALASLALITNQLFIIVPLGDGEKYTIPSYELDETHVLRKPLQWWAETMINCGYDVDARYKRGNIKSNWIEGKCQGNGFIVGKIR